MNYRQVSKFAEEIVEGALKAAFIIIAVSLLKLAFVGMSVNAELQQVQVFGEESTGGEG